MESGNPNGEGNQSGAPEQSGRVKLSELAARLGVSEAELRQFAERLQVPIAEDGTVDNMTATMLEFEMRTSTKLAEITHVLDMLTPDSELYVDRDKNTITVKIPGKGNFTLEYNINTLRALSNRLRVLRATRAEAGEGAEAQKPETPPETAEAPSEGEEETPSEEEAGEEGEETSSYAHGEIGVEAETGAPTMSPPGSGKGPEGAGLPSRPSRRLPPETLIYAYWNTAKTGRKTLLEDLMMDTLYWQQLARFTGTYLLRYLQLVGSDVEPTQVHDIFSKYATPEAIAAWILSTVDLWHQYYHVVKNTDIGKLVEENRELKSQLDELNNEISELAGELEKAESKLRDYQEALTLALINMTPEQRERLSQALASRMVLKQTLIPRLTGGESSGKEAQGS